MDTQYEMWENVAETLLEPLGEGEEYLCDMMRSIIFTEETNQGKPEFESFLYEISNDEGYAYSEAYTLDMPSGAPDYDFNAKPDPETGFYPVCHPEGSVYIGLMYIREGDPDATIELERFIFMVKVASVFYAQHIHKGFDVWPYFRKLDQLLEKYHPFSPETEA